MARPTVVARLPAAPGVYRFRDDAGRVAYLGRATDLRSRVGSYWGDLADRPHLRRMIPQVATVEALECDSVHEAAWLERNLLERARPRWNRLRGGLEVPTWIALDRRPDAASLSVVHSPADAPRATVYGPYLGGGQTRLAVAGLERALALAYAGRPRGGFDRDMARVRGVADGDLDARVARVVAVLTRDPDAVAELLGVLVRRRAEAASACAFEVAARVQAELEAVAWVTSEQKVTRRVGAHDGDLDAHGWCEGVLVTLEVRAGRLSRWLQRPADDAAARHLVAATPGTWHGFADRAARLAARLAQP